MELVKTIIKLDFADVLPPWLEMRELVRVVGENPKLELQGAPLVIDIPGKKQRVVLHLRAFTIEQEGMSSTNESMARMIDLLTKVNSASKLPSIPRIRLDSIFIEPFSLPFHELVILMKNKFLKPGLVVDVATDVGFLFDLHEGNIIKHIQIGPMEPAQLHAMFLAWPREKLPAQFIFVSLGYEQNQTTEFNSKSLREFFEAATGWQKNQAELIINSLRV